jgi:DNA-binding HxlR family transcriptional regulator
MPEEFRYAQFCPLARAMEVLGERWTLLVVRELLLGPQRFTDLRRRLPGLSSSVLAGRLERLEERGILGRRELPPPAASTVYELRDAGHALAPAVMALARWGTRFLLPPVPGDHVEPDWTRLALRVYARRGPTPHRCYELRVPDGEGEIVAWASGGPAGTSVGDGPFPSGSPDATLRVTAPVLLGLMSGLVDIEAAQRSHALAVEGDAAAAAEFCHLFEVGFGAVPGAGSASDPRPQPREES